jgi:hypothetical protein
MASDVLIYADIVNEDRAKAQFGERLELCLFALIHKNFRYGHVFINMSTIIIN